jgi:hypothetical protein
MKDQNPQKASTEVNVFLVVMSVELSSTDEGQEGKNKIRIHDVCKMDRLCNELVQCHCCHLSVSLISLNKNSRLLRNQHIPIFSCFKMQSWKLHHNLTSIPSHIFSFRGIFYQ